MDKHEFEHIWEKVLNENKKVDIEKVKKLDNQTKMSLIVYIVENSGDILEELVPSDVPFDMSNLIKLGYKYRFKKGDLAFLTYKEPLTKSQ